MQDRFSVQQGIVPPPSLGLQDAPHNLRVTVWNILVNGVLAYGDDDWTENFKPFYQFLHWPVDEVPHYHNYTPAVDRIKKYVLGTAKWHEFFDLVQFAAYFGTAPESTARAQRRRVWNSALENEGCAYRFVGGRLAPLSTEEEQASVEEALSSPLKSVRSHVLTALQKLSDRPAPDIRNAIKEAISAVESALKVTTDRTKGDLRDALPAFESKYGKLHPAFRGAVEKLYAYTSDEKGVRHSLLEDDAKVDFDDARFMVIACSALCNFLVARATSKGWTVTP
ncbi:MAG TPA: hypothetical protein VGM84_26315 [Steroidobacteraceae bacterium]|jgi:hypothetical protein